MSTQIQNQQQNMQEISSRMAAADADVMQAHTIIVNRQNALILSFRVENDTLKKENEGLRKSLREANELLAKKSLDAKSDKVKAA